MVARLTRLIAYFDTSAFIKLLVGEQGSTIAVECWLAAERSTSSLLLYLEARAAIARAGRMGRITPRQLQTARDSIDVHWRDIAGIDVTERIVRRAGDLAEGFGLRAYDAVHLASFEQIGRPASLVAADNELLQAADAMGFATVPVT